MYSSLTSLPLSLLSLILVLFSNISVNCEPLEQTDGQYVDKWIKLLDTFEDTVNPRTNSLLIRLNEVKNGLNVSDKCLTSVETLLLRTTKDDWALKSQFHLFFSGSGGIEVENCEPTP